MTDKLVNVRLDARRRRKARALRESGRTLSDVVRDAIDSEYGAVTRPQAAIDPAAIVAGILSRYPDSEGTPARTYDVHDRRSSQQAIARALTRRRK